MRRGHTDTRAPHQRVVVDSLTCAVLSLPCPPPISVSIDFTPPHLISPRRTPSPPSSHTPRLICARHRVDAMSGSPYAGSSSLSVTGRSLNARPASSLPFALSAVATPTPSAAQPISPTPQVAPSSPSTNSAAASPFHSSHPSSPVHRFNQSLFMPPPHSSLPVGGSAIGGKFQMIQRPLASRVPAHGGGVAAFQHSVHPTAVQASHALGQSHGKEKLPAASRPHITSSGVTAAAGGGSPVVGKLRSKEWYGTFPRLGSPAQRLASGGGSPSGAAADLLPPSPVRASPQGRSPEPLSAQASPSMLHPRAIRTGSAQSKVSRTPPQSHHNSLKKKSNCSSRRDSADVQVDVELGGPLAEMDIADEATTNSGYNSDASAISVESHASSFPVEYIDASGAAYAHDEDVELAITNGDVPQYRGGFPASPLQLRAGAPHPSKMYGGIGTPVRSASGTNSVRSVSRIDLGSADHSALQSPQLDSHAHKLVVAFPMSPIQTIDSIGDVEKDSLLFPSVHTPSVAASPPHEFTTVPALNLPRSAATIAPTPRSPTVEEAAAAAAAAIAITPHRHLADLVAVSGVTSAFSSARSLAHSGSATSVGEMEWHSTPTERSLSGSHSLYSPRSADSSAQTTQR